MLISEKWIRLPILPESSSRVIHREKLYVFNGRPQVLYIDLSNDLQQWNVKERLCDKCFHTAISHDDMKTNLT